MVGPLGLGHSDNHGEGVPELQIPEDFRVPRCSMDFLKIFLGVPKSDSPLW